MFCLRQKISRNPARITVFAENNRFSWAGRQIDRTIAAHKLLGGGDVLIARSEDFFDARNRLGAVGKCGNGLSAADASDALDPEDGSGCKKRGVRPRANDFNLGYAGDDGRHNGHDQGGDKRELSPGNVAADGFNRAHDLADLHAGFDLDRPRLRQLAFRKAPDIARGVFDRADKMRRHLLASVTNAAFRDPQIFAPKISTVELLSPREQGCVATLANVSDDLGCHSPRFRVTLFARTQKLFFNRRCELDNAHQSTILFKGYSTIPWALAALSFGKIWRTTASSTMVLMATHSGSLKDEIVGFFRAGSTPSTAGRSSRWTLRRRPTLLAAAMAPCSIRIRFSAFSLFQASAAAARFMMNTVADSRTVSTMRKRFARSDAPVSVTSTMASASCGTLTSVAPQENSTRAFTPCFAR